MTFDMNLLYVADPAKSAAFYRDLLGCAVLHEEPGFALLAFAGGVKLGLWRRDDVKPPAAGAAGSSEIAFTLADAGAVDALHAQWRQSGVAIAQPPVALDFGHTFTALDPDGHRLRVFARRAA